jgi:ferrous iron transport protein B
MTRLAIVGNPNTGKTTIFNSITGSRQRVGNYPGVTVEEVEGEFTVGEHQLTIVDVPGLYSLKPVSEDERVAVRVLKGSLAGVVYVLDATNIQRNLFLFGQIRRMGIPMMVALTMGESLGVEKSEELISRLEHALGVPVIAAWNLKGNALQRLKGAMADLALHGRDAGRVPVEWEALDRLRDRLARHGVDYDSGALSTELRSDESPVARFAADSPEIRDAYESAREAVRREAPDEIRSLYAWAAQTAQTVEGDLAPAAAARKRTDRIDAVLTHRVLGLVLFLAVMYGVFQSIYTLAGPVMELIDGGFAAVKNFTAAYIADETLRSFVVDGLIGGVGSAVIFLPQILILFFFIAVLEGSGYLARAAFLMDRLLGWCGLNGRAFIPLLSSFACAIPGIMAARVMPDSRSRLATILVAPLMSCSARLPVYVLLIGAIIQPRWGAAWAGAALFGMHLVGLVVALPIALILNRGVLKSPKIPFLLELPPYRWPNWRDVALTMFSRAKVFLRTAGTIIVVMSVAIWALLYFPRLSPQAEAQIRVAAEASAPAGEESAGYVESRLAEKRLEQSYLGRFGKAIEPAFLPAGFDWRITTAILSAFPAREVLVSSLGIIFSLGGEVDEESPDLRDTLRAATWPDGRPLLTPAVAVGLMVFFALCAQCMATLAAVKRETNSWKWAVFMFSYMTGLAYLSAVAIHQIAGRA